MKKLLLLFIASILLSGCTVPIRDKQPIRVPSGLNENHVETAILLTVGDHTSEWQMITDNALRSALRGYQSAEKTGYERYWYFEEKNPGVVFVGFRRGELYLRVALHFDRHQVNSEIVESKNFRQTAKGIHKNAYQYLQDFEHRLQRSLGDVSKIITYRNIQTESTKIPASTTEVIRR